MAKIDKNERTLYQFWTHTVQKLIECSFNNMSVFDKLKRKSNSNYISFYFYIEKIIDKR